MLAYGQTGSGKTHTMGSSVSMSLSTPSSYGYSSTKSNRDSLSSESKEKEKDQLATVSDVECSASNVAVDVDVACPGIIPYAVQDFYKKKAALEAGGAVVSIEMSFLEIYNEKCYDLLSTIILMPEKEKENCGRKEMTEEVRPCLGSLRENAAGETVLDNLASWPVANQAEVGR